MSYVTSIQCPPKGLHLDALKLGNRREESRVDLAVCRVKPLGMKLATILAGGLLAGHSSHAFSQAVTKYSYDRGDHVSTVIDPRGLVTSYAYDGLGQKWQQVSPDTGTTTYGYDASGHATGMTRAGGILVTYGYDAVGRTTRISAGSASQTFTYDTCTYGVGRLCSVADASGTTSYSYTREGWLAGRGFSIGGASYALGYGYSPLGQVTAVIYPDGNQALYAYTNGVVSAVQVKIGNTTSYAATGINYRPNDLAMVQWTSSNGLVNALGYDTDGRLTGVAVQGVQSLGLSYDVADRINGITNGIDGAMTQNFGYDAMSRLTSVYAVADNQSFQYDANGNRTRQVLNGGTVTVAPSPTSNQIVNLSGASNASYGYDARGNLTTVSGVLTFTYDAFNRMSAAGGATYYINAEGQRLRKTVGGASTYFAPDAAGPLLAESQGSGWTDYIWLNGRLIGRINSGQLLAVHDDQVGRPEAMTDANKAIVWRARNFAFDRIVTVTNSVPLNLGFPGQYYDAESGLWNNGFRDYSPNLGRYVQSDPVGLVGGINTYAYVGGNPLSYVDPLGLWALTPDQQAAVAAAAKDWSNSNVPYVFGGSSKKGADCSGSVSSIFDQAGIPLGRKQSQQFKQSPFEPVPAGALLEVGDVGVYPGHVVIYGGDTGVGKDVWSASHTNGPAFGPANSAWYGTPVWYRYNGP